MSKSPSPNIQLFFCPSSCHSNIPMRGPATAMETMGARCCERAVGLATIQRQDNSEGMHGMHFGHTSLCGQPKVDSRMLLAGWFGSVPHQALEPGLVEEKESLLELSRVQHWPIPPLATGYFMESGIGYSHSQSHL